MAERGDPQVLKHVVVYLLDKTGMKQEAFARKVGTNQAHISNWTLGKDAPPDATLRRMAEVANVPGHVVRYLIRFLTVAKEAVEHGTAAGAAAFNHSVVDNVLLAVMPHLIEVEMALARLPNDEALREAEEIWATLEPLPAEERRRRIETAPPGACRSWAALVKVVCEASERLAADRAGDALEVARLAQLVAERVVGDEGKKAQSFGWAYLGNARRVANDFADAGDDFTRAWTLWPAGTAVATDLFPEWRLLDLEASLRRAQHRWDEALERLARAKACWRRGSLSRRQDSVEKIQRA